MGLHALLRVEDWPIAPLPTTNELCLVVSDEACEILS